MLLIYRQEKVVINVETREKKKEKWKEGEITVDQDQEKEDIEKDQFQIQEIQETEGIIIKYIKKELKNEKVIIKYWKA